MWLMKHNDNEVHVMLDPVNVKQLWDQMLNFPSSPNWVVGTLNGVKVKVSVGNPNEANVTGE